MRASKLLGITVLSSVYMGQIAHADPKSPYEKLAVEEQRISYSLKTNHQDLVREQKRLDELLKEKEKDQTQTQRFLTENPTPSKLNGNTKELCDSICQPKRKPVACQIENFTQFTDFKTEPGRPACLYLFHLATRDLSGLDEWDGSLIPHLSASCSEAVLSCPLVKKAIDVAQTRAAQLGQIKAEIRLKQDLDEEYSRKLAEVRQKMNYWALTKPAAQTGTRHPADESPPKNEPSVPDSGV